MKTVTVPTEILEAMKIGFGSKYFNNEIDATMNNVHIRLRVEKMIQRKMTVTSYTDGVNELIVVGEGMNQQHFTGTGIISA